MKTTIKTNNKRNTLTRTLIWVLCSFVLGVANISSSQAQFRGWRELPEPKIGDILITNQDGRYTYVYDTTHRLAKWVAHTLTQSDIKKTVPPVSRQQSFMPDSLLYPTYALYMVKQQDYDQRINQKLDRGHLVPFADRKYSYISAKATFLFTNVAPQINLMDNVPWNEMEQHLREKTSDYDTLYIVTGVVATTSAQKLSHGSKISIPDYFFKAIVAKKAEVYKGVAYVMKNNLQSYTTFKNYKVSIDSVQNLTELKLFPKITGLDKSNITDL